MVTTFTMARRGQGSARTPMHLIISEKLRKQIENGVYAPGDQLPSEFDLGQLFGVSRTTVRRAIANLINQGLVETQQGKGIFVKEQQKISFSLSNPLTYFDTELERQGRVGSIHTITSQYIEAPREIINRLKLPPDKTRVCQQEKLILADDMPIALDIAYLPEEIGLKLTEPLQFGFTYRTLEDNGYPIESAKVSIEGVPAGYETSEYLNVALGAPLLVYRYLAWNTDRVPLVCGETISRADCTIYVADLNVI
ncbi:MAG: GntR family transcriptional regulator [Leptolyngbyaceae bacterium]|nr:GntR family transcriptional regulator [Leptolyngbyaceae bacterium]